MTLTEHDNLRAIAEQVTGRTLPRRSSSTLLEIIEQNIGTQNTEATGTDYTITNPDLDTLSVDTSDGPVTVTLSESFYEDGASITISDVTNNASVNNITVNTGDSVTINGSNTLVIDVNGGAATVQYNKGLISGTPRLDITATVGAIL